MKTKTISRVTVNVTSDVRMNGNWYDGKSFETGVPFYEGEIKIRVNGITAIVKSDEQELFDFFCDMCDAIYLAVTGRKLTDVGKERLFDLYDYIADLDAVKSLTLIVKCNRRGIASIEQTNAIAVDTLRVPSKKKQVAARKKSCDNAYKFFMEHFDLILKPKYKGGNGQ